ncbi:hypothetical protein HDU92_002923 [Lobulomyces angularis]|nr:hypothetical protein HDU92_002923 [Lobulomyces angularis]
MSESIEKLAPQVYSLETNINRAKETHKFLGAVVVGVCLSSCITVIARKKFSKLNILQLIALISFSLQAICFGISTGDVKDFNMWEIVIGLWFFREANERKFEFVIKWTLRISSFGLFLSGVVESVLLLYSDNWNNQMYVSIVNKLNDSWNFLSLICVLINSVQFFLIFKRCELLKNFSKSKSKPSRIKTLSMSILGFEVFISVINFIFAYLADHFVHLGWLRYAQFANFDVCIIVSCIGLVYLQDMIVIYITDNETVFTEQFAAQSDPLRSELISTEKSTNLSIA